MHTQCMQAPAGLQLQSAWVQQEVVKNQMCRTSTYMASSSLAAQSCTHAQDTLPVVQVLRGDAAA